MTSFEQAFDRLMENEGGLVNDPNDPGGLTKFGISQRSYPHLDIEALTREDAKAIYYRDFWQVGEMERFPPEVVFQVFDFAVNSGINTALRKLQAAAGVADDGYIGPISMAAIKAMSVTDLIMRFAAQRLRYMTRLKNWPTAGAGWANRIARDLEYGAEDS